MIEQIFTESFKFKAKSFKLVLGSGVWEVLRGNEAWTFVWHKTSSRAEEQISLLELMAPVTRQGKNEASTHTPRT